MSQPPDLRDPGIAFALDLGRALQTYGAPAHRLEDAMKEVLASLGVEGEFFSIPTGIFATLGSGDGKRTEILRIDRSEVDLTRLSALSALSSTVASGEMTPREGSEEIRRILTAPPQFGPLLTLLAFALTSAAVSRFFGAGLPEVSLSFVAGLAVGLLALAATGAAWVGRLFDPLAGFVVSLIAVTGVLLVGEVSVPIVTVAGLIVLVPGYTLTVAINELAQRNLVSGSARLMGALVVFLMLGFGVAVGGSLGSQMIGVIATPEPVPLPPITVWLAVLIASITLPVLFRAPLRDFGWIIAACFSTFLAIRYGAQLFRPELGAFLGAAVAGSFSNLYSRFLGRPAAVTRVPSLMLLVPGGLGFLGISSLLEQDTLGGFQTFVSVGVMAVALVTGLLISNAIVPPGRKL
jgi:uncharacterized membrane protein YjjP (DUF1212 family)